MKNTLFSILKLSPALAAIIFFITPLSAKANECVTSQCHATLLSAKNVHAVADPCDTCHQAELTPHPQKKKTTFTLVQDMPALCSQCHRQFNAKFVHTAVAQGMCTSCHNPHSSNETKLLSRQSADLCTQCHSDKSSHKFIHGPVAVGDCMACHNPHESELPALGIQKGSELCFTCHPELQAVFKKQFVHSAMGGGCTSCHNPHGSNARKFLSGEGEQLCFQCHPAIQEKITKAKIVHKPITSGKGCGSCHTPHAADLEKLLFKKGKELCLECHKDFLPKDEKFQHGPVKVGKCSHCHDPHGSPNAKLLNREYNTDFYIPYTDKEYSLCFNCHKRELLAYPTTSYATGFRDGERNLHYLHVNIKDKGRNCKLCHLVHGSGNPKLIADKVLFGKWNLPIKFVKTETGGSCAPGCHKSFNYDRKTPGKAPEKPKSSEKAEKKRR